MPFFQFTAVTLLSNLKHPGNGYELRRKEIGDLRFFLNRHPRYPSEDNVALSGVTGGCYI